MGGPQTRKRKPPTRRASDASWASSGGRSSDAQPEPHRPRKRVRAGAVGVFPGAGPSAPPGGSLDGLLGGPRPLVQRACMPPARLHPRSYHRPLMLCPETGDLAREALLRWFDGVSASRQMPWRKPWIDPTAPGGDRQALERRAYEVWISEIMLQQTRVAVVIGYWERWMARWPTIQDLAAAEQDEVLSAWRGLGYYSRATRIHEAAKLVVGDPIMQGLLPQSVPELEAKVPGVGRYTAGAICAIAFGCPAPMVDGNVIRVLSRQLGIFGNPKSSKAVLDAIWGPADALAHAVAQDGISHTDREGNKIPPPNDRPGRWGQALMELGSTICTPKPTCNLCPVTSTCRAYGEGLLLATTPDGDQRNSKILADMEDLCTLCEDFEAVQNEENGDSKKEMTTVGKSETSRLKKIASRATQSTASLDIITDYARRFPIKAAKKAVREEEILVCAICRADGQFLIHRRPETGLLASMWELPSQSLPEAKKSTSQSRKREAKAYASKLVSGLPLKRAVDLGPVPWLFSHIKLTMHTYLFVVEDSKMPILESKNDQRWDTIEAIDRESIGTGMRKCWSLAKQAMET